MFVELLARFGYPALFLGTLVEGETFILLGGFLAHRGYLRLALVILVAALGAFSGDVLYFLLGRHYGRRFLERTEHTRRLVPRLEGWMARYQVLWIFGMRYLYGIRWLGAALAGSTPMSLVRFAALSIPACLLWALVVGGVGYATGEAVESILGDIRRYEGLIVVLLAAMGVIYGLVARREEQRLEVVPRLTGTRSADPESE